MAKLPRIKCPLCDHREHFSREMVNHVLQVHLKHPSNGYVNVDSGAVICMCGEKVGRGSSMLAFDFVMHCRERTGHGPYYGPSYGAVKQHILDCLIGADACPK